jgi:hypothetical protein
MSVLSRAGNLFIAPRFVSSSPIGWSATPLGTSLPSTSTARSGKHATSASCTAPTLTGFVDATHARSSIRAAIPVDLKKNAMGFLKLQLQKK